jgi:putative salt-induced outer membrane protein
MMLDLPPLAVETSTPAPSIPADLQLLIDAAVADGDDQMVSKLLGYIERTRPDLADAVAAVRRINEQRIAARQEVASEAARRKLADAGPLDNWSGQVEFGASWSTGPAESLGAVGALDLKREGLAWTHRVLLRGEVQDTDGIRAVERIIASWQPRYAVSNQAYVFGLGQYERDPALCYEARYSAAIGAGWALPAGKPFRLSVEGGPALRRTLQAGEARTRLAGRGTLDLGLVLGPRLELGQRASLFYEDRTSSGVLASTIDSKISEKLKLRFTYEYRIEEDGITGTSSSGSISRASLVYRL